MKQLQEDLQTGKLHVFEVPDPSAGVGKLLVRNMASAISIGTEGMMHDFAKKSWIGKALDRPDLVKQVVRKIREAGLKSTLTAVRARLEMPFIPGYSSAGIVEEVGQNVEEFSVGERVACAAYATHSELVLIPRNFCVRIPEKVDMEEAAFTTLGAVALQAVRLAEPTIGERFVVIGLGLIGQITSQVILANGCRVLGVEPDPLRAEIARKFGIDVYPPDQDMLLSAAQAFSGGRGVDGVIICAASDSEAPVRLAGEISRLRGRVIVVGAVKMDIPRKTYYERELTLKVSMSYGPGRYDQAYEERGQDYPYPYVRWTAQRNMQAFLDLVEQQRIHIKELVTHTFPFEQAERAYELMAGKSSEKFLGVLLTYPAKRVSAARLLLGKPSPGLAQIRVGLVGAGNYARTTTLPILSSFRDLELRSVASSSGTTARAVATRFHFSFAVANYREILNDSGVNFVIIATRHNLHATLAQEFLRAGKHVLVEKPLGLNLGDIEQVLEVARESPGRLLVGFNRRYAPLTQAAREWFRGSAEPLEILYRINAGALPSSHWLFDPAQGGGRVLGEACHFVDWIIAFAGSPAVRVLAETRTGNLGAKGEDVSTTLRLKDGTLATIFYAVGGDRSLAKERIEISGGDRSFVIDNFERGLGYRAGRVKRFRSWHQDKGQRAMLQQFLECLRSGNPSPQPLEELAATSRATLAVVESLRRGTAVDPDAL